MGIQAAKERGLCPTNLDQTIMQVNFGMKKNTIIENLRRIDELCNEVEILYIKFHREKEMDIKEKIHSQILKRTDHLKKEVHDH